jgi:hypothetical protein
MSGSTISGTIDNGNSGVVIGTGYYASPLTVTSTGVVQSTGVYAVEGVSSGVSLLNYGSILGLGATGVSFITGGLVENLGAGALIQGETFGVESKYARTFGVINEGTITGLVGVGIYGNTNASGSGFVNNEGTAALISGNAEGVAIVLPGTVFNQGTITVDNPMGTGVLLDTGGSITNQGFIYGFVAAGVGNKPGFVTNEGTISGIYAGADVFGANGTVSNLGATSVIEAGTFAVYFRTQYGSTFAPDQVYNAGRILGGIGGTVGVGVDVQNGLTLTNALGGVISGGSVGVFASLASQLSNEGSIAGGTYGIKLAAGGTLNNLGTGAVISSSNGTGITSVIGSLHGSIDITNEGTIQAFAGSGAHPAQYYAFVAGVYMYGGTLVNSGTAALISGGIGVHVYNRTAYVANSGTILGDFGGLGINKGGGTIANLGAHALIEGDYLGVAGGIEGVRFTGTLTTVYNQGSIIASGVSTISGAAIAAGVDTDYGLVLTNAASGFISSKIDGVYDGAGLVMVSNAGTIEGSSFGLNLSEDGTYNNSATIANSAGGLISGGSIGINAGGTFSVLYNTTTIRNSGTVQGGATGIKFSHGGYVGNLAAGATIAGGAYGVIIYGGGNVTNQGTITGVLDGGVVMRGPAVVSNAGVISGGQYGVKLVAGGDVFDSGTISGQTDAIDSYYGAVRLTFAPGAVINGSVAADTRYAAVMELATGSTGGVLDMGESFSGIGTINFDAGVNWVLSGTAAELAAGQTINGFAANDTIIVEGFTESQSAFIGNTLFLVDGAQTIALDLTGDFAHAPVVSDVAQGTEIAVCYLRGTRIATPQGERLIEDLAIGDEVLARSGATQRIRFLGEQRYARRFLERNRDLLPVRVGKGALGQNLPRRDLFVSPGHSLLLNGILVLAKALVNGITIAQDEAPEEVHYLNIELEAHDCVLAEGIWAETYAECAVTRWQFHNTAAFFERYPGHEVAPLPVLCAPRPLAGGAHQAALAPVVARAAAHVVASGLMGFVDQILPDGLITGWAVDEAWPELAVWLDIWLDEMRHGSVLACDERDDLRRAGFGQGRCAFSYCLPAGWSGVVSVRRASDGAALPETLDCQRLRAAC